MAANGPDKPKMLTTDMIAAQALELADNMRSLATQSMDEATRLSTYANSAANSITEAVNRFTNQTSTLLTFIDKTTESCQVALDSIDVFTGTAKGKLPLNPPQQEPRR